MTENNTSLATQMVLVYKFWICIKNLHQNVPSDDLAENILMNTQKNMAWIVNFYIRKDTAETKARTLNDTRILNQPISVVMYHKNIFK